jgi:5-methylcytosine-specific restriction protein B
MPEYQFANSKGEIITEDYDRSAYFSAEQVLQSLRRAFSLFPYETQLSQVDGYEDVFCVEYPNGEFEPIYICGKGTTPGGRQGLKDEQRIQPKAKFLNYVYDKYVQGKKGVFLGVYSKDGQEILCTWKVMQSSAASVETPISKQIKIDSIAKAIQEGFVQQDKGRGEYACAFKPEFLYFYLKNSDWLHTGTVTELAEHTPPEAESTGVEENEQVEQLVFCTGVRSQFPRNRILFGAPGTGKSYTINQERKKLIGEENETDYERVTFHPDYSYANFVGTYKPVMVEGQADTLADPDTKYVLSILTDKSRTAQEKYDLLYDRFKDEGLTRLPVLLGLYTDESFKTRKQDGSDAAGDNSVEKNHGRAIRKYVNLITGKEKSSDIAYEYVPGPFMRVYVNALKSARTANPKPFLLIIEEINRANVAAVFGDIFQLLDRGDDEVSEYPIQASEDIKAYLAKELGGNPEDYAKIRIPDNMFIWATMNSADQGVFPMDTAFKRRWDFTYLGIDDSDEKIRGKYVYLADDKSQKVEWNKLRKAINHFLAKEKINEDKQLGPYFISRSIVVPSDGDEIDRDHFIRVFKNKVIMYLFEDAAKQKRAKLFEGCFQDSTRYSEICREFDAKGIGIFNHEIQLETEPEEPRWAPTEDEN